MYPPGDGKVNRVQLKDGNTGELVSIGIKKLVIVNVVILSKDPLAIRAKIGLRRLAFDLVVQRLLPFVGMRQIELVGEEKSDREQARGHHNRGNNAIDAHAGSFHRRDLIAALHQAEGDQHRQQYHQRCHAIQQIRGDIQQIFRHDDGRRDLDRPRVPLGHLPRHLA